MSLKTLVVDDHEAARLGLTELLDGNVVSVTETVADGESALRQLAEQPFDVVLVDVQMKKMDGLALLASIRESHPDLPVVFISAYDYPIYMARAVANGAQDYVLKSDPAATIEQTLSYACSNGAALPNGLLDRLRRKMTETIRAADLPPELPVTPREAQVLRHVAFGLSNREIAASLGISVETVKEHVQNILRKTGASDRTDVAVRAVRLGLVD
ncbi:response regulator transcription factor [Stieleria sp. TO1_6]|uniref:response regulator transcription factor n=1 Tax=Stieleria tagensis TaxID=2956795 RepID=UPI00209B919E|nr:response regulator transcription factor [Stieleria tagensis]MCO8125244.1 response regulator transcription factor [Stieleria tagensis]